MRRFCMGPKIDRSIYFIFLALVNLGVIWFTLSTIPSTLAWIPLLLVLASLVEDGLILGWSLEVLPNYGFTDENSLAGIWLAGQVVQMMTLTFFLAGLASIMVAVVVFVLSILWIAWRSSALNKVMDLRYWQS